MEHPQGLLTDSLSSVVVLKKKDEVQSSDKPISIQFVGSSGVGKTSLITKLCTDQFVSFIPTIGTSYFLMGATVDGKDYQVKLLDTAGQERFTSLTPNLYRAGHGTMIVYDITSYDSYERIKYWMLQVQQYSRKSDGINQPTILLGNKTDVDVSNEHHIDGRKVAEDLGMDGYFKTSAKTGEGIYDAIKLMISIIVSRCYSLSGDASLELRSPTLVQRKSCCQN